MLRSERDLNEGQAVRILRVTKSKTVKCKFNHLNYKVTMHNSIVYNSCKTFVYYYYYMHLLHAVQVESTCVTSHV